MADLEGARAQRLFAWLGSLALVLGLHVAVFALMMLSWVGAQPAVSAQPPAALMIDLTPLSATAAATDIPVGPDMVEAVAGTQAQPEPEPQPEAKPQPQPKPVEKPEPKKTPVAKPHKPKLAPPPPPKPAVEPEVKVAAGEQEEEKDQKPTQEPERRASAAAGNAKATVKTTSAQASLPAPKSDATVAPDSGASSQIAKNAVESWQGKLLAKLERLKRYPGYAQRMRQEDVVYLKFAVDRRGQLLSYSVEKSQGYSLLDKEARDLVQRAAPFPAPPEEVSGNRIELVVPIEFFLSRS